MTDERFQHATYLIRKKILSLGGGTFEIFDAQGALVLYSKMKRFRLKEDIRLYTNADMTTEVLAIRARRIVDFSGTYDVIDSRTGEGVGALQRSGWRSMLRDQWIIRDVRDNEIGSIQEEHAVLALVRRFVANIIPQSYRVQVAGASVAEFKQNFNPFVTKLTLDFSGDAQHRLDRRLGIAAGVLLCAIEGKQEG